MYTPEEVSSPTELSNRIGEAIVAYANVEGQLAILLKRILNVDFQTAYLIFFAVQNTRARGELFDSLIANVHGKDIGPYWDSCSTFLAKLAKFRNALAHWQPMMNIYYSGSSDSQEGVRMEHTLAPGNLRGTLHSIEARHIGPFLVDCMIIRERVSALETIFEKKPETLPEIFLKPIPDRNQAVLRQRQIAKEPRPPRPPSVPKLSQAQKRAKALKDRRLGRAKKS